MANEISPRHLGEKRSEHRNTIDQPYSVEIDLGRPIPAFQLKLRDISGHGSCILVQENSSILDHLMIGQNLKMKYWTDSITDPGGYFRAQVIHISKPDEEQFSNHYSIGLLIEEKHDFVTDEAESESIQADSDTIANLDRRQTPDRRIVNKSGYVQERRSGQDRRSGLDRRAGADRRAGVDRRNERNF
jgi:hypothetical protein